MSYSDRVWVALKNEVAIPGDVQKLFSQHFSKKSKEDVDYYYCNEIYCLRKYSHCLLYFISTLDDELFGFVRLGGAIWDVEVCGDYDDFDVYPYTIDHLRWIMNHPRFKFKRKIINQLKRRTMKVKIEEFRTKKWRLMLASIVKSKYPRVIIEKGDKKFHKIHSNFNWKSETKGLTLSGVKFDDCVAYVWEPLINEKGQYLTVSGFIVDKPSGYKPVPITMADVNKWKRAEKLRRINLVA